VTSPTAMYGSMIGIGGRASPRTGRAVKAAAGGGVRPTNGLNTRLLGA
jgi:hypothetical protein